MPSPFPGMDPYLEDPAVWPSVHSSLLSRVEDALNAALPDRYLARTDRHVWLAEPDEGARRLIGRPDNFVAERIASGEPASGGGAVPAAELATLRPTRLVAAGRREGHRRLKIIDRHDRRVVTVIELLSPANKRRGSKRAEYLGKRRDYWAGGANLVEIDLLRRWPRMPVGQAVPTAYCALVVRAAALPAAGLCRIPLREPLPTLPVPLGLGEADVPLPLQPLLDALYDRGRYASDLDYTRPPPAPAMNEVDAAWVRERLAAREGGV